MSQRKAMGRHLFTTSTESRSIDAMKLQLGANTLHRCLWLGQSLWVEDTLYCHKQRNPSILLKFSDCSPDEEYRTVSHDAQLLSRPNVLRAPQRCKLTMV
uniref:Uncharacterized protein n=1 Tax=Steinernema glaseri TaxID=37863 RepID=A0A1I7ZMN0_9BILA